VVLVDKSQNSSFRVEGHDRGDDSTILCNIIFDQFNLVVPFKITWMQSSICFSKV
jgi:hypothetical protein